MPQKSNCRKEDSRRKRKRPNPPKKSVQRNVGDESVDENADIPLDVIKSVLEGSRIQVSDSNELCQMLSKCSYIYLREVIEIAFRHMRRCERTELTVADFNFGLNVIIRCKILQGFTPVCEAGQVNLTGVSRDKDKVEKSVPSCLKLRISGDWLGNDSPFFKCIADLPVELLTYFRAVTKALLNPREELYLTTLTDLKSNQNILHLLPYFMNFLSTEIDRIRRCYPRVTVLLKAMQSLLSNPHFECHTYSSAMADSLLKCLLDTSTGVKFNMADWSMRETAADVLAHILKICRSEKLCFEVLSELESAFSNLKKESAPSNLKNLVCHYGIIFTVNSVGVFAVMLALSQHIDEYIKHLNFIELADYHTRRDSCMIRGQLIHSYYLLICHFLKYEFKEFYGSDVMPKLAFLHHYPRDLSWKNEVFPVLSGVPFFEYFGDALIQYFPLLSFVSYNLHIRRKSKLKQFLRKKNLANLSAKSSYPGSIASNKGSICVKKNDQIGSCNEAVKSHIQWKKSVKYGVSQSTYKSPIKLHSVFDIVPLKSHTIKFAKIKGTV